MSKLTFIETSDSTYEVVCQAAPAYIIHRDKRSSRWTAEDIATKSIVCSPRQYRHDLFEELDMYHQAK